MRAVLLHFLVCVLCLLRTVAEEVPLPRELLDRLSWSEIRSISDLERLLGIHSVENEVIQETKQTYYKDVSHGYHDLKRSQTHTRRKRSTVVEEAVPAGCKARTVVHEISRNQVDPTAANFLVWPPCVELRRCTGCCNTGNMCCVPTRTRHRTVKVAKVEYVRRRPKLREVQVSLEEHLDCMCTSKRHIVENTDNDPPLPPPLPKSVSTGRQRSTGRKRKGRKNRNIPSLPVLSSKW